MSLQDITITSSINSIVTQSYGQRTYIASTDDQSFPIEAITGSYAGAWPNFKLKGLNSNDSASNTTVNLFVNVTQSWSGSNVTPLGIIPFIHNTMEEFIDGEFSGSNYVISDGSLNDEQCEQFLTVNTTPVAYKVFPFYKNNIQDPANVYLDGNTAPLNGEIYIYYFNFSGGNTRGIYAKIARIDALGNDNTLSLQELTQFRYTDSGTPEEIIFDVINISEYPDYYFYEITTNVTINVPQDDNYYLHSLSASFTASSLPAAFTYLSSSNGNWTEITDNLNYFDGGKYIFGDTPNIPLQFTSSFKFTVGGTPTDVAFSIIESTPPDSFDYSAISSYIAITSSLNLGAGTYIWLLTGSGFYTSIKNYFASLVYSSDQTITNVTASFIITQSQSPQTSTSSFVIEPYLLSTFAGSDCDVLLNNYSQNDINSFYRKVLYDDGYVIPSNLEQIVSGTAEFAEVTDYLYSAQANTLPRYKGVRVEQQKLNVWSQGDIAPSKTPSVTDLQTYFAYFDFIQDTSNELINKSAVHILYLIDKDGNISTPTLTGSYYWNLIDNFETDKYANVIVEGQNGDRVYLGNKRIIRPAALPRAILYSQTGSGYSISNTIQVGDSTTPIPSYNSKYATTYFNLPITPSTGTTLITPITITKSPSTEIDIEPANKRIKIKSNSNLTELKFKLDTFHKGIGSAYNGFYSFNIDVILEVSTDGVNWTTAERTNYFIGSGTDAYDLGINSNSYSFNYTTNPIQDTYYRIKLYNGSGYYAVDFFSFQLTVSQTIPSTVDNTVTYNPPSSVYFTTGSSSSNILTSSILNNIYNPDSPYTQLLIPGSGYGPNLPFTIQPFIDQIRFEGDENQVYTILEAISPTINEGLNAYLNDWYVEPLGNWSVSSGGVATCTGGGFTNNYISQSFTIDITTPPPYKFYFTVYVDSWTSGDLFLSLGSGPLTPIVVTGTGFYNVTLNAPGSGDSIYIWSDNFIGSISSVFYSNIPPGLYLKLDRNVTSGTQINSFLIRRLHPHPSYVTLNMEAQNGNGYLFPEYATDELRQNFDNIIISLRERSLI